MRGSKWIVGILCLGAAGILGATVPAVASLEYFYAKDGTITGRCVNGKIQHYSYDKKGQLTAVVDFATHEVVEQYVYDPAGNILRKTVNGRTTVAGPPYTPMTKPISLCRANATGKSRNMNMTPPAGL